MQVIPFPCVWLRRVIPAVAAAVATQVGAAADPPPADMILLDEVAVRNLRLETVDVEEADFEETAFALGRIEAVPSRVSGVSSRIPGRIVELRAWPGDFVSSGDTVALLESRQPGSPPPVIPLTATGSGLVTKGGPAAGEPLEPEQTLLQITDLSEVFAVARVPEHVAGRMKPGVTAHIRLPALPDSTFDGELLRFGTEADRESGTIDAFFRLPNPENAIRPGMRAEFSIVLDRQEGVMSVPRAALQGDGMSRYVFVRDFELPNAFHKAPVETGRANDRFVEIVSGLFPGDSVVTRGSYALSFAGRGTISMKEALDAAHGHEHAEDGSELPGGGGAGGDHGHDHEDGDHGAGGGSGAALWQAISALLAVLLVIQSLRGRSRQGDPDSAGNDSRPC